MGEAGALGGFRNPTLASWRRTSFRESSRGLGGRPAERAGRGRVAGPPLGAGLGANLENPDRQILTE
jgi:hypothetical protein